MKRFELSTLPFALIQLSYIPDQLDFVLDYLEYSNYSLPLSWITLLS